MYDLISDLDCSGNRQCDEGEKLKHCPGNEDIVGLRFGASPLASWIIF